MRAVRDASETVFGPDQCDGMNREVIGPEVFQTDGKLIVVRVQFRRRRGNSDACEVTSQADSLCGEGNQRGLTVLCDKCVYHLIASFLRNKITER